MKAEKEVRKLELIPRILLAVIVSTSILCFQDTATAQESGSNSEGSDSSPTFIDYQYTDFGVKISYPETWELEAFAYDDRHFRPHPGHLPGLPLQFFQPTELDIRPQNKEIYVLGLYPPFEEDQASSDAKFLVIVEKVGFNQDLAAYVRSYVSENIVGRNPTDTSSPPEISYNVVEQKETKLSENKAIMLVSDKKWGWNSDTDSYQYVQRAMKIFTLKDDRIYILQYAASMEQYEKHLFVAQRIADSFVITSTGLEKTIGVGAIAAGIGGVSGVLVLQARRKRGSLAFLFIANMRRLLPAALGIEILCISAAEIGGNLGLYLFGFNLAGIAQSYVLVYAIAGFTTFAAIIGRSTLTMLHRSSAGLTDSKSCDCCSVLEHDASISFASGIKLTFKSFGLGIKRIAKFHKEQNRKQILKTTIILLLTAESGCILTAATVDFLLYQYSLFISVPLSLAAGTVAVAAPHALSKAKRDLNRRTVQQPNTTDLVNIRGLKDNLEGRID